MENYFFGTKEIFGIEVEGYNSHSNSGKIRFWLNGKQFGDLKTKDEMYDAVESLEIILFKKEILYEQSFDLMTNEQIFSYCLFLNRDFKTFTKEDYDLVNKMRQTFSLWFGEQLDNVAHVIFYKEKFYHFLWSYNDYSAPQIDYLKNLQYTKIPEKEILDTGLLFLQTFG